MKSNEIIWNRKRYASALQKCNIPIQNLSTKKGWVPIRRGVEHAYQGISKLKYISLLPKEMVLEQTATGKNILAII